MDAKPKSVAIAKWGAACAACANAKAKCLRSNDTPGSKCDRCDRLDKTCVDQVHRPRKKRQSKPSKTAQLEERLNSLVDLLKASNGGPAGLQDSLKNPRGAGDTYGINGDADLEPDSYQPPLTTRRQEQQRHASLTTTDATPGGTSTSSSTYPPHAVPAIWNQNAPPRCICRATAGEVPAPMESDETLLSTFLTRMATYYPFVVLPPGTTVGQLESTKPLLLSAIKMVASVRHLRSLRAQSYLVMKHISEHLLLRSERSLELLQTILLLLGWYHYHCMMHAQMNNLTALAYSLATDLYLNKPPGVHERTQLLVLNPSQPGTRTNDERRALCGVWYIGSVVSLAFSKMDQPRYTPYIDRCVRELEEAKEYDSDLVLVQLVRIQHLSDRISQLHAKDRLLDDLPGIPRAPVNAYLNVFQAELNKHEAQIPRHLKSHKLVLLALKTATLRLWEPPVLDLQLLENLTNSLTSMSLGSPSTLDILYRSNAAVKDWFDFWLTIEVTEYFYIPLVASSQLIVAVTMLARWAKLSNTDPAPPPSQHQQQVNTVYSRHTGLNTLNSNPNNMFAVNNEVPSVNPGLPVAIATLRTQIMAQKDLQMDIGGLLGQLEARLKQAKTMNGSVVDNDIWDMAAKKISIVSIKLDRWAEIITTMGLEGLLTRKPEPGELDRLSGAGSSGVVSASQSRSGSGLAPVMQAMDGLEQQQQQQQTASAPAVVPSAHGECPVNYNTMFAAEDIFNGLGLDQGFFFDDGIDIDMDVPGFGILSSIGPIP